MSFGNLLRYAVQHPLGGKAPLRTAYNIANWQLRARLLPGPQRHEWIGGSCLMVRRGMTGATGNIYYGLHEFYDMSFLLHFLRRGDVFADVGANVGSYSVLAAKVCDSDVVSFEPDPETARHFMENIDANQIHDKVELIVSAVGNGEGTLQFTVGLDTVNHVVRNGDEGGMSRSVPMTTLDVALADKVPIFMKIDVEGFEDEVISGGSAILSSPELRCIEIETVSDDMEKKLSDAGFLPYAYDPWNRKLSRSAGQRQGHNQLFVRDLGFVEDRVRSGAPFRAMGRTI